MTKKKALKIDMIAGSQLRDTQGEMLSVEGADISELIAGRGRINDNHGKGFFNAIGRVTGAKKIFKREDCDSPRHEYYWDKIKAPYIYVEAELFDEEDHPNARAAAAILRNIHKTGTPLQLKASVEGGVVARGLTDPSLLARTKIHSVALTFTPANNNTLVEPLSLDKTSVNQEADMNLIKSLLHLAETNVPSFRHIQRDASATKVQQNLEKMSELMEELGLQTKIPSLSKRQIIIHSLEQKITNNIKEIYNRVAELNSSIESLEKGKKELMQVYGKDPHPEAKAHVEWASKLPNANWQQFAVRSHRDNPSGFTDEHKKALEHFSGMAHVPDIKNFRFDKSHDLDKGIAALKDIERKHADKMSNDVHFVKPDSNAKQITHHGQDKGWFDIGKSYCEDEASAMGHCGNVEGIERDSDRILSFRDIVKAGDDIYHKPNLTFINNNGYLGEMKGRANEKPNKKYHKDIVELLKDPSIKGIVGGGYEADKNFSFSDLSAEHQAEVLKNNPNLITDAKSYDNVHKLLSDKDFPKHHVVHVAESAIDPRHQEQLIDHEDHIVRKAMAENPNLDPKFHEQLVNDDDEWVRSAIAQNPNLDPKFHEQLVNDNKSVRRVIAKNPNLDPKFHEQLVNDDDEWVRRAMAEKPNLDPKFHEQLVNDDDEELVRRAMAENPNLDPKFHEQLVNDDESIRLCIANNPNLDPKFHGQLVNDNKWVRRVIAKNPNLDPKFHEQLVNDDDEWVRSAIAQNPNLDPKFHEQLVNDDSKWIRWGVARNPNLDPKFHEQLVNDDDGNDDGGDDDHESVRQAIARNPNLDPKFHEQLVNDDSKWIRFAMAENPNISVDLLRQLANDKSSLVADLANQLLTQRNLNKGLKESAASLLAAGALATSNIPNAEKPASLEKPKYVLHHRGERIDLNIPEIKSKDITTAAIDLSNMPANHRDAFNKLKQRRPDMAAIAMHESSGGANYNHKTINNPESMHHGMTAGGMFGLMPITIGETVRRSKTLKNKYPELAKYTKDARTVKENHKKITQLVNSNPEISIDIAENLFNRKMQLFNNHLPTVYHSWNRGVKGTIRDLSEFGADHVHHSPYSKKTMDFYKEYKKLNDKDKQLKRQDVLKALTAGYGGGSPMSNSGGLVLQSESLGDPSFKYINCEKCGKEQIYAKHQVKCRSCGQHFSMEKLYDLMVPKK